MLKQTYLLNNHPPRKPKKAEKKQLIERMATDLDYLPRGYIETHIKETAYIAVFDDYATEAPGYRGKLMMIVWGDPMWYDVYTWDEHGALRYHKRL